MQGKKDYQEKLFNSFQLSERVPEENFYRKLKSELDLSFITPPTKLYYGEEGQKSRLKLWLAKKTKLEFFFLPPYSPDLNAVERAWVIRYAIKYVVIFLQVLSPRFYSIQKLS